MCSNSTADRSIDYLYKFSNQMIGINRIEYNNDQISNNNTLTITIAVPFTTSSSSSYHFNNSKSSNSNIKFKLCALEFKKKFQIIHIIILSFLSFYILIITIN